ncbi:delta-1-pyrroline-5-carboxylate dehydrogenase, mitochondrial-like [Musca vetustissima]|uniref:delta-1-pyrroline-5-carboxylate dehydrogenase, mitochondrial-like n=1 Tax=Musca vetustissima TaxID=27455 RepID=UPI002AB70F06|nr:delta-1-pyrroline-5-carboxylate dehydrogenase, mitochondrial-like [Musca vetustissima]
MYFKSRTALCFPTRLFTSSAAKNKLNIKNQSQTKSIVDLPQFDPNFEMKNEPILKYNSGSEELNKLQEALKTYQSQIAEIPIIIGGKEFSSKIERFQIIPHRHHQCVAKYYEADENLINKAIRSAVEAKIKWSKTDVTTRIDIWLKAAELMSNKYKAQLVAATMLGQSKTLQQAEIDAGVELIDFMRINAGFLNDLCKYQPFSGNPNVSKNHMLWRPLDGFVAAISPFNFTAIGGNLAYTPALIGNTVLWKPPPSAMLSSWLISKIMQEAGLPDGVVNFIPANGPVFGNTITYSSNLGGINFTGSLSTFRKLWKLVSKHLEFYKSFPRLSGECGGKNYHFVHASADVATVVACTIRSAFEYSGQKCSACSRLYVPQSLWESEIKDQLCTQTGYLLMGDVCDVETFLGAVIDDQAFLRIAKYLDMAKTNPQCDVLIGGRCTNLRGYFVEPTIVVCRDPYDILFKEEIFGPLLTVYVYKESELMNTLDLVGTTTKYALTGSIFAKDEEFLKEALNRLQTTAGNLYINDKSSGAVVGQQPFGGSRLSGTNDKPGSPYFLMRWSSPLTIKETFEPQSKIYYSYMRIGENCDN